jgi:hypothetical protein
MPCEWQEKLVIKGLPFTTWKKKVRTGKHWVHSQHFCFCFEGAIHDQFFCNIVHSPIEAPLWALVTKQKQMCSIQLTFTVYIHQNWTLGKAYGINLRCYWERLEERLGNVGNLIKIPWEQDDNTLGIRKNKINSSVPSPKEKHAEPSHWLHELLFPNCLSPFLAWANGRDTNCGT